MPLHHGAVGLFLVSVCGISWLWLLGLAHCHAIKDGTIVTNVHWVTTRHADRSILFTFLSTFLSILYTGLLFVSFRYLHWKDKGLCARSRENKPFFVHVYSVNLFPAWSWKFGVGLYTGRGFRTETQSTLRGVAMVT